MKVTLNPIYHRDAYAKRAEAEIVAYFRQVIFGPLLALLPGSVRQNETQKKDHPAVWDALLAGTIWYMAGVFTGAFNAAISRELRAMGARRVPAGFGLAIDEVPLALRGAISLSVFRAHQIHRAILAELDAMLENMAAVSPGLVFADTVDKVMEDLQEQLVQTVSEVEGAPKPAPVPPGMVEAQREKLAEGANRVIKGFSLETTQQLRAKVQQNLRAGGRTDRLSKIIEAEFGVAQRKARVIAEAETSQLVSDFRKDRYEALGSTEYVWSTSHDEKVRPTHGESNDHRSLDGRRFSWASPPVVDSATGRRRHPGEDYGPCRCVARPVLNFL